MSSALHQVHYDLLALVAIGAQADVYPEGWGRASGSLPDELVEGQTGAHPAEPLVACLRTRGQGHGQDTGIQDTRTRGQVSVLLTYCF